MAESTPNKNIESWMRELESVGRVEIGASFKSLLWRVGLAIVIVFIFIFVRYEAGDIGQRGLTIAIVGFAVLILGCIAFVKMKYGDKSIVVERDSVTLMDGYRIPFSEITEVTMWSDPRARTPSAAQINLTEPAWEAYMANQGAGGKLMHKANKMVLRNRAVVLPTYIDASQAELAAWLNVYARGENPA